MFQVGFTTPSVCFRWTLRCLYVPGGLYVVSMFQLGFTPSVCSRWTYVVCMFQVGFTPDVLTDATAELVVAVLLMTGRRLVEAREQIYK